MLSCKGACLRFPLGRLSGVGALWDCVPCVCGGGGGGAGGGVPLGAVPALSWCGEVSLGGIHIFIIPALAFPCSVHCSLSPTILSSFSATAAIAASPHSSHLASSGSASPTVCSPISFSSWMVCNLLQNQVQSKIPSPKHLDIFKGAPLGSQSHSRISSMCVRARAPFVYEPSV